MAKGVSPSCSEYHILPYNLQEGDIGKETGCVGDHGDDEVVRRGMD